ncbi:MAG: hypothetical protein AAF636_18765 [Pseudomonadota bacterium]
MTRTILVDLDERQTMKLEELLKVVGGRDDDVLRVALDRLYEHHFEQNMKRERLKPRSERLIRNNRDLDHDRS